MKVLLAALACVFPAPARVFCQTSAAADSFVVASLKADVDYLASRKLEGRAMGTPGGDSAAAYIARRYDLLGLVGPFPSPCTGEPRCGAAYFQFFPVEDKVTENVAALVPGTDRQLHNQYIVVGAHYDHLGRTGRSVMDPDYRFALHPGADDNASGTAVLLELARRFSDNPTKRGILLVSFGAEERGLFGSMIFINRPPLPEDSIVVMVNFDMVGRLRANTVVVGDLGASHRIRALIDSSASSLGLHAIRLDQPSERTDADSFIRRGIQTIGFTTGGHVDYHTALDLPERVNVGGMKLIADMAERVIRTIADSPDALKGPTR